MAAVVDRSTLELQSCPFHILDVRCGAAGGTGSSVILSRDFGHPLKQRYFIWRQPKIGQPAAATPNLSLPSLLKDRIIGTPSDYSKAYSNHTQFLRHNTG